MYLTQKWLRELVKETEKDELKTTLPKIIIKRQGKRQEMFGVTRGGVHIADQ